MSSALLAALRDTFSFVTCKERTSRGSAVAEHIILGCATSTSLLILPFRLQDITFEVLEVLASIHHKCPFLEYLV
jgi:hypothetical protein